MPKPLYIQAGIRHLEKAQPEAQRTTPDGHTPYDIPVDLARTFTGEDSVPADVVDNIAHITLYFKKKPQPTYSTGMY